NNSLADESDRFLNALNPIRCMGLGRIGSKFSTRRRLGAAVASAKIFKALLHTARDIPSGRYGYAGKHLLHATLDVNAARKRQMVIRKRRRSSFILKGRTIELLRWPI